MLTIDLSRRRWWVEERPDLFEEAIGGSGVAIRMPEEVCPEGVGPLDSESPIVMAVGPLVGLFPMASKTVAMFKWTRPGHRLHPAEGVTVQRSVGEAKACCPTSVLSSYSREESYEEVRVLFKG